MAIITPVYAGDTTQIQVSSATNSNLSATQKKPVASSASHEAGRKIYNFRCYFCHGYSGDAKTLAASFFDPKPRNFSQTPVQEISRAEMIKVVTYGSKNTAMQSFANTISAADITTVVDFIRREFMENKAINTYYHTKENGWDNHQRYKIAYPFATGEIPLDRKDVDLTEAQIAGKQLFMNSCVTCHDRANVENEGLIWQARAVSYPRNQYSHKQGDFKDDGSKRTQANKTNVDAVTSATVYAKHDIAPTLQNMSEQEKSGQAIFQANCAFCHAADGTGKNWIGSFLQTSPRNLTDPKFYQSMSRARLKKVIEEGLPNSTMSSWKNVLTATQIDYVIAYVYRAFFQAKTAESPAIDKLN